MKLTQTKLKDLIQQVYLDSFADLAAEEESPLLVEPESNEPPPALEDSITESKESTIAKVTRALQHLEPHERKKIFSRFGFYSSQHLLSQLNAIKKAEKGAL